MKHILCALLCCLLLVALLPVAVSADTIINGVYFAMDYPEAGKAPIQTATWLSEGYSIYSIDWYDENDRRFLEPGDKIKAGHSYTATLWVEAGSGYDFNSVDNHTTNVTAYVNGEKCEVYKAYEYTAWAMVCVDVYFADVPEKDWINSVAISVPVPVAGEKPSYDKLTGANCYSGNVYFSGETDENMVNGVSWHYVGGDELTPATAIFSPNTAYRVHFLLFPDAGYRFTRNASVTVNGQTAKATLDYDTFLAVSYDFPATGFGHTHTPSDWRTTGAYHYTACTECGDFLQQEDHKGGVATCVEKGVCSVCGYAYLETTENHVPDTGKWIARLDMYHFHACKLCGAHCDIGDHVAGPAGTPDAAVVCKDCGYVMTPAKNHTHKLTKVEGLAATCTSEGSIEYYKCDGCSDLFTDAEGKTKITDSSKILLGALGHETGDTWGFDEGFHWRSCNRCKEVPEGTKMAHEGEESCTTCGYMPGQIIPTETTPATTAVPTTTPTAEEAEPQGNSWLLVIVLGLVCFGIAITATVIILKRKK